MDKEKMLPYILCLSFLFIFYLIVNNKDGFEHRNDSWTRTLQHPANLNYFKGIANSFTTSTPPSITVSQGERLLKRHSEDEYSPEQALEETKEELKSLSNGCYAYPVFLATLEKKSVEFASQNVVCIQSGEVSVRPKKAGEKLQEYSKDSIFYNSNKFHGGASSENGVQKLNDDLTKPLAPEANLTPGSVQLIGDEEKVSEIKPKATVGTTSSKNEDKEIVSTKPSSNKQPSPPTQVVSLTPPHKTKCIAGRVSAY